MWLRACAPGAIRFLVSTGWAGRRTVLCEDFRVVSLVKRMTGGAVLASALLAAGCSNVQEQLSSVPNAGPCPVAASLYDASRLVEINGEEVFSNVGFTGEIRAVQGFCRYYNDTPITMEIDIDFAFGRGPAAQGDSRSYDYFVTVTRRNSAVIHQEVFTIEADFRNGADRTAARETIKGIVIPRANDTVSGSNFEVLVGFKLTEEQLAYNRSGKRFLVRAGQGN